VRSALLFSDASMTYFLPKQNKYHYNGYFRTLLFEHKTPPQL